MCITFIVIKKDGKLYEQCFSEIIDQKNFFSFFKFLIMMDNYVFRNNDRIYLKYKSNRLSCYPSFFICDETYLPWQNYPHRNSILLQITKNSTSLFNKKNTFMDNSKINDNVRKNLVPVYNAVFSSESEFDLHKLSYALEMFFDLDKYSR